jgi:hypothetical protein
MAGIVFQGDPSNGGWLKRLLMWDWHAVALDGWPGWERTNDEGRNPHWVSVRVRHKLDPSTHEMSSRFDDVAEAAFYNRDHTKSGLPFCSDGEEYRGSFWFQTRADAERFRLMWLPFVESTNYLTRP